MLLLLLLLLPLPLYANLLPMVLLGGQDPSLADATATAGWLGSLVDATATATATAGSPGSLVEAVVGTLPLPPTRNLHPPTPTIFPAHAGSAKGVFGAIASF